MDLVVNRSTQAVESDNELVCRMAAGNEDALRRLYDTYGQRLYSYALHITGDPATAEEAVQESLIAAWQGASRFRREGRVIAWLLKITHHKALNQIRGKEIKTLDEEIENSLAQDPLPDEQAAVNEQRRMIKVGLDRLSMEHRTVLELVFYQGLNLNEVADVCGCPLGTVKSRLNYAKASLRGLLSRTGMSAEDIEA